MYRLLLLSTLALLSPRLAAAADAPGKMVQLTAETAEAFGRAVERGVAAGEASAIDGRMDFGAIADRALAEGKITGSRAAQAKSGFLEGLRAHGGIGAQVVALVAEGGHYEYLGLRKLDGITVALFRMFSDASGLNYHGYRLASGPNGLRAVDLYTLASGEWFSSTVAKSIAPLLAVHVSDAVPALAAIRKKQVESTAADMQTFAAKLRGGDPAGALAVWHTLPDNMRETKPLLIMALMAASQVGDAERDAITAKLEERYPGDPCLDLCLIDTLLTQGKFASLLQHVDHLDQQVGGDAMLNSFRCMALRGLGRKEEGYRALEDGLKAMPHLEELHWNLLTFGLEDRDDARVVRELEVLEGTFGVEMDPEMMENATPYAAFVKTQAYRDWLQRRAAAPADAR